MPTMARRSSTYNRRDDTYRWLTHRPLNCLVFILPLLGLFHLGSALRETSLLASHDMQRILGVFGATAWYLPPMIIAVVLILMHQNEKRKWRIHPPVLGGMIIESILWAIPLFAINYLCARFLNAYGSLKAAGSTGTLFDRIILDVGAGVYEEFLFRLVLLGALTWALGVAFRIKKDLALLIALIAGAAAFSLYHFSGAETDTTVSFTWGLFIFRMAAGVCLGIVFAFRGFGIAVGAHAVWNIFYSLNIQ